MAKTKSDREARKNLKLSVVTAVLTEAGYRCAVPTCRTILAIDLHHLHHVSHGGKDEVANLIALCPTCHALYHRGTISHDSIYAWKAMIVAISRAFDVEAIDKLLFLAKLQPKQLTVSGDGVLQFARLIAADLASFHTYMQNGPIIVYEIQLTQKGRLLIEAWKTGDRAALQNALIPPLPIDSALLTTVLTT